MARGSINKVILIGTLGRDVEMRYMPNGNAVANCSLATDEGYKDRNTGQHVDKTEWHRVEAFGRLAEIMGEYLKKGSKVYVEGKLRTDEYEKDGIKRYSTKIIVNEMTMLDTRGADNQGSYQPDHQPRPSAQPQAPSQQASKQVRSLLMRLMILMTIFRFSPYILLIVNKDVKGLGRNLGGVM